MPLVDLGLRGGVSTLFAYGQTGSGKTFTVSGILEPLAHDLFNRGRFSRISTAKNASCYEISRCQYKWHIMIGICILHLTLHKISILTKIDGTKCCKASYHDSTETRV